MERAGKGVSTRESGKEGLDGSGMLSYQEHL
jgi:hypothetical protein